MLRLRRMLLPGRKRSSSRDEQVCTEYVVELIMPDSVLFVLLCPRDGQFYNDNWFQSGYVHPVDLHC